MNSFQITVVAYGSAAALGAVLGYAIVLLRRRWRRS